MVPMAPATIILLIALTVAKQLVLWCYSNEFFAKKEVFIQISTKSS